MAVIDSEKLAAEIEALPGRFRGPGGVLGVVIDGKVVARRAWGFASLESGQAMTAATRLPVCSVSKQFTCAAMLAACGEPDVLDERLAAYLPNLEGPRPGMRDLCNNQSGLRDYWALTVLHGGRAEQVFSREDGPRALARTKSLHFAPGTSYSYSNGNFRILGDIMEEVTGEPLEALYARHIWQPAGMATAVMTADTARPEDGVTGYEGNDATGYLPAHNAIHWRGDAAVSASLDDMLAYECWIDAGRDDPASLYRRIAAPQCFRDGNPAAYGFGLQHSRLGETAFTGHGGALRGFRIHRMYSAEARLSVVVMFNHHGDAHGAAQRLARAALGLPQPVYKPVVGNWEGQWLCPETGLLARLEPGRDTVSLRYGTSPETLSETPEGTLVSTAVTLRRDGEALFMERPQENCSGRLEPVAAGAGGDISGHYRCAELEAEIVVECRDGGAYLTAEGFLGRGRPEILHAVSSDLWLLSTRRSMDAPAPGDWTLRIRRDRQGGIAGLTIGCWLARDLAYEKIG